MQAIVETLFDAVYLTSVIAIGVTMIVKSRGTKSTGCSASWPSSFGAGPTPSHLVPRASGSSAPLGLENFIVPLGHEANSSPPLP